MYFVKYSGVTLVTYMCHYRKLFSTEGGGSSDIVRDCDRVGGGWVRNAQYRHGGVEGGSKQERKDLACQLIGQVAGSLGSFWDCFGRNLWWEQKVLFENVGGWSERIDCVEKNHQTSDCALPLYFSFRLWNHSLPAKLTQFLRLTL